MVDGRSYYVSLFSSFIYVQNHLGRGGGNFFLKTKNPKPEKALKKKKTPFLTNEKHLLWR